MFERFSPHARRAVVIAQELARELRQPIIAPVHLLLGALGADDPAMEALLAQLGADGSELVEGLTAISSIGSAEVTGHIPFHSDTKRVIVDAVRTASALGDDHVGTPHLLLAMLHLDRGRCSAVLAQHGVTTESVTSALGGEQAGAPTFQVRTTKGAGRFRRGKSSTGAEP
ncbi:Clp protease N-terminal domain-containing protein [Aquihabitans sp. McL0605]|uniref:Clp protease N-terminal domain-containing protein n=1 Tax=Aquihabitans sp. McL0605 TaxID=3415671 RepID=UPI003CF741AD